MPENSSSVILTVYNQEPIVDLVFCGIADNISDHVKEIIVILDGCTDGSEEKIRKYYERSRAEVKEVITPNLNEVLANNVGLRMSTCEYSIIVQDDCVVKEKDFDLFLMKPYRLVPNLLAVSGRDADDYYIGDGTILTTNTFGVDVKSPRGILGIRDAINRGPLMLNNEKLKQLDYLDESFAPINADDIDLSLRAFTKFGYLVGAYCSDFYSPVQWGKTRNNMNSYNIYVRSAERNRKRITEIYADYFSGYKHSLDIIVD